MGWARATAPPGTILDACLDGGTVVALVGDGARRQLALTDGTGDWRLTATLPDSANGHTVSCLDGEAVVHDDRLVGSVRHSTDLDPTALAASWSEVSSPPNDNGYPTSFWTGSELLFLSQVPASQVGGAPALAYEPVSDSWRMVDGMPSGSGALAWTGSAVVGFGEIDPPQAPEAARRLVNVPAA